VASRNGTIRTIALAAAVIMVASAPAVHAGTPAAGAGAGQGAFAAWIIPTSRTRAIAYFVHAERVARSDASVIAGSAIIARGRCTITREANFVLTICSGFGKEYPVDLQQFQMDPLLRSAHLSVRGHEVDWTGRGKAPLIEQGAVVHDRGAEVGVAAARLARASATLFGEELRAPESDFSAMFMAAGAGVSTGGRFAKTMLPDGTWRIRWRSRTTR